MGDQDVDIVCLQSLRNQQLADFLEYFGLLNLLRYFRKRLQLRHIQIWWQIRQEKFLH